MTLATTRRWAVHPMLAEHIRGDSYRELGRRHGIHHEIARRIVLERGKTLIRDLERDLRAGRVPLCTVPYGQQQRDWQDGLLMLSWAVDRLRNRGLPVEVVTCPNRTGVTFQLSIPRGHP